MMEKIKTLTLLIVLTIFIGEGMFIYNTSAEDVKGAYGSISYIKEGWILENKTDIGSYLDIQYKKVGNRWQFTVVPDTELIGQAKKDKPDFSKLNRIKYRENLKKINRYPVTLQMQVCKKDETEEWINVTKFYLSKNKLNLLDGVNIFEINNLDLNKHKYRLKIGFHSVTYSSAANTITVVGGTESNPYTFEDLYQADVSNGWGVINKTADHSYVVDCFIVIGDGSTETYFADENKQVNFRAENFCTSNGQKILRATSHTHIRFGKVVDEDAKATGSGCQFMIQNDVSLWLNFLYSYGQVELYSTSVILTDRHDIMGGCLSTSYDSRIWNCIFENSYHFAFTRNTDIFNLVVIDGSTFLRRPDSTTTVNHCVGLSCSKGVWFQGAGGSVKDVYGRKIGYAFYLTDLDENDDDCYIINGDFDNWKSRWKTVVPERKVYRQYSVNLKVVDEDGNPIENATVKLYDNNNTLVVNETTDVNGTIPEQTVTYGYYQRETDGYYNHDEIFHSNSPHTLIISKEGYNTYEVSFELDKKIDWTISLKNETTPPSGSWNAKLDISSGMVHVYGTEYNPGEQGVIYAQVLNSNGTPANNTNVTITIWNVTNTFISNQNMTYINNSNGIYYYSFTVPNSGVFVADVRSTNPVAYGTGEFHVSDRGESNILSSIEEVKKNIMSGADVFIFFSMLVLTGVAGLKIGNVMKFGYLYEKMYVFIGIFVAGVFYLLTFMSAIAEHTMIYAMYLNVATFLFLFIGVLTLVEIIINMIPVKRKRRYI